MGGFGDGVHEVLEAIQTYLASAQFDWVNVGSALVSILAALVAGVFSFAATRKEQKIFGVQVKIQHEEHLIEWSYGVIRTISGAMALAGDDAAAREPVSFDRRRRDLMADLSCLVEQGRLDFPNVDPTALRGDKEGNFQHVRPPVLDALVLAHDEIMTLKPEEAAPHSASAQFLFRCRRAFVEEMQDALDPKRRHQLLADVAYYEAPRAKDTYGKVRALVEELESRRGIEFWDRRHPAREWNSPKQI